MCFIHVKGAQIPGMSVSPKDKRIRGQNSPRYDPEHGLPPNRSFSAGSPGVHMDFQLTPNDPGIDSRSIL